MIRTICMVGATAALVASAADAAIINLNEMLSRAFVTRSITIDEDLGNLLERTDRFTNITDDLLRIELIDTMLISSHTLGYPDIEGHTLDGVLEAASDSHADYGLWGWGFQPNAAGERIDFTEVSRGIGDSAIIELLPGESFELAITARSEKHGAAVDIVTETVGEHLIGFRFEGQVLAVPTPASMALAGVGLAMAAGRGRRGGR